MASASVVAGQPPDRVRRFSRSERALHWVLALTTLAMLATGFALWLPALAQHVSRPLAKGVHLYSAVALGLGLLAVIALGDRRGLRRTVRELDRFDADDARWLSPGRTLAGAATPPQGRFNAGQKVNSALVAALLVLMTVSGLMLWGAERYAALRGHSGPVAVHDLGTLVLTALVAGHLYLAVLHPSTRHALRGITTGEVDRAWAEEHHAKWAARDERDREE